MEEMVEKGNNSFEIFKAMRFTVTTMGADVEFYKRIFNNERIAKMNKQDKEIEYIENECRNLKEKIENTCTREQLFLVNEKFYEYALKDSLKDIRDDL